MGKRFPKTLILTAKLVVAGGLLLYVLSQVHWHDYAVATNGREMRVYASRTAGDHETQLKVKQAGGGFRWLESSDFRPVSFRTARGEIAIVRDSRPDWSAPEQYLFQLPDGKRRWLSPPELLAGSGQFVQRGFLATLCSARPVLLIAALVCFALPQFILALRWWYLLRILEIDVSLWEGVRLTFLGLFFNYVVPGTVSGDLVKAYYVHKHTPRKAAVLVSVFVDRAVGLLQFAILPAMVIAVLSATAGWNDRLYVPAVVVAVVAALVAASLALLLSPGLRAALRLRKLLSRLPLQHHIAVIGQAAALYRRRAVALAKALGITFGGQVFFIAAIMLAGKSLGIPVAWYQYFLYVPLIYIIAAVPISPGGLGLAETFYVTFFTAVGAGASEMLALAVVARLVPMLYSLPGVVVAMRGPKLPARERMEAELAVPQAD